jgi:hypothetical protein
MFDCLPVEVDIHPGELQLLKLADDLRHRERWPLGFKWDYGFCSTCAIGLFFRLRDEYCPFMTDSKVAYMTKKYLSITEWTRIFVSLAASLDIDMRDITPDMVANAIEETVRSKRASKSRLAPSV